MELICAVITGFDCEFKINSNSTIPMLVHINEIHDPDFVPRCNDDLIAEYREYHMRIIDILSD